MHNQAMQIAEQGFIISAFLMGFLGSSHCLGMCGGISATLGLHGKSPIFALNYNLGRIITYTLLGLIVGSLVPLISAGKPTGNMIWARRSALIFIFLIALMQIFKFNPFKSLELLGIKGFGKIRFLIKKFLPPKKASDALILGLFWGFLPCGMIYQALLVGLSLSNPFLSASVMLSFGLGTLPAMFGVALFSNSLNPLLNKDIFRISLGVALIVIVLFTWK